jgi:hypothetical protein
MAFDSEWIIYIYIYNICYYIIYVTGFGEKNAQGTPYPVGGKERGVYTII